MNYFVQNFNNTIFIKCTGTGIREYIDFNALKLRVTKKTFGQRASKEECIKIHNFVPLPLYTFLGFNALDRIKEEDIEVKEFIKGYLEECLDL